jgi:hypothetical protein
MDERQRFEDARRRDVRPGCEESLMDRAGAGALTDGVFCDLECQAEVYRDYFEERRDLGTATYN